MTIWKTKYGWRAEFVLNGKRIMAKGPFKYKDDARQWVKEEKENLKWNPERLKEITSQGEEAMLWPLSQEYLETCEIDFEHKTFEEKRFCLKRFYEEVGDIEIIEITPSMVLNFINKRAKEMSNNAANKDRKNLKAFFKWTQRVHNILHDPTAPIEKKKHTKKSRRLIPIKDILSVIMAAKGEERNLIGSYWHTGGRRGEILRWAWADDINFEERWVRLGTKKSHDGSMQYEKMWMNDDLHNLLMNQWKNRDEESPYVFPNYYCPDKKGNNWKGEQRAHRLLKDLCERAEIKDIGYHDIRHTVAKYLNDLHKVGLKKVQQVLRHKRQTTTEIYVEGNYTDTKEAMTLLEIKNLSNLSEDSRKNSRKPNKKG